MAIIKFIEHSGTEHEIDIPNGLTIMEGATKNKVPGIDADCGGACACATCHVYINEKWIEKIPQKEDSEEDMLDLAVDLQPTSRLGCQIEVSQKLEGLVVKIPEND